MAKAMMGTSSEETTILQAGHKWKSLTLYIVQ
jgi:hypothetical protein